MALPPGGTLQDQGKQCLTGSRSRPGYAILKELDPGILKGFLDRIHGRGPWIGPAGLNVLDCDAGQPRMPGKIDLSPAKQRPRRPNLFWRHNIPYGQMP